MDTDEHGSEEDAAIPLHGIAALHCVQKPQMLAGHITILLNSTFARPKLRRIPTFIPVAFNSFSS